MSKQAGRSGRGSTRGYDETVMQLQQLAVAPDPATFARLFKSANPCVRGPELTLLALAQADKEQFKAQIPALAHAYAAACTQALRLLDNERSSSSSSSTSSLSGGAWECMRCSWPLMSGLALVLGNLLQALEGGSAPYRTFNPQHQDLVPALCKTDLLPRLASAAELLVQLISALPSASAASSSSSSSKSSSSRKSSSSSSSSSSASSKLTLSSQQQNLVTGLISSLLLLWEALVTADSEEEGFSISLPACVAALPSICSLARAVMCRLPFDKSLGQQLVSKDIFLTCHRVANFASGHLHMQYCKAFAGKAPTGMDDPERGCSRATAHMLARCEDCQWLLLAYLGVKLAAAHKLTKGGMEVQDSVAPGVSRKALLQVIQQQMLKSGDELAAGLMAEHLQGMDDDGPFANTRQPVPPFHEQLLTALGMGGMVRSGLLAKCNDPRPVDRKMCRMALWSVEYQFLQVDVPAPGTVGIPCGAHGPLLAALCEYLVTVGPASVQFHACLTVARLVMIDYGGKLAAGTLPLMASQEHPRPRAAAGAGALTAPAGDDEVQLDEGMVHGLSALLSVGVPACVLNARKKVQQTPVDIMEPSLMPVQQMSDEQWACWLLPALYGIMDTILDLPGSNELLTAAVWRQQPSTAAAALEWLNRAGPLNFKSSSNDPLVFQGLCSQVRLLTRACAAPPSAAAAAPSNTQVNIAGLLATLLKRLKLHMTSHIAPPAAFRGIADIAAAAAALGASVASVPVKPSKQSAGSKASRKGQQAASSSSSSSPGGPLGVKDGPALWAVVVGHSLWSFGSQLPTALDAAAASSAAAGWSDDAPDQLLGTFKAVAQAVAWLATALPALSDPVGMSSSAGWSQLWQALQQQTVGEAQAVLDAATAALQKAAAGDAAAQWQEAVRGACPSLVSLGAGLLELLPCAVCCNHAGCCQLDTESERRSAENAKTNLMKCSSCKTAQYCSRRCQKLAWPGHKQACRLS